MKDLWKWPFQFLNFDILWDFRYRGKSSIFWRNKKTSSKDWYSREEEWKLWNFDLIEKQSNKPSWEEDKFVSNSSEKGRQDAGRTRVNDEETKGGEL